MKFINYLETITGVGFFGLTSLLIFFIFFTGLSLWAFRADKSYINSMKEIPLSEDPNNN